jgi:hypothetical protein
MNKLSRPVVRRTLGATASVGVVMALLAGCSSSPSAVAATGGTTGATTGGTGTTGNSNTAFPGASGQIAAVSGKTLQVQGASSQTAVTYTASTKITEVVSAAESDLAVGKCVSVTPVASTDTSGSTATTPDLSAPITAASVSISDAVNGSCMRGGGTGGGFGGGHRAGATGATGATGAAAPSGSATGATGATGAGGGMGGGMRGGGGANGMIASISGDTMTVTMMTRPAGATGATGSTGSTTVTRTVTLNSSTTYTETQSAADSALTVGKCVSAVGTSDSSGAITASSISIRPMVNGSCSTGFGGRGMRGGGFGGGTGTAPAAAATS